MVKEQPSREALLDVVGRIYATALQPDQAVPMLQALKGCLGAAVAQSYTYHRRTGEVTDSQVSDPILNEAAHAQYVKEWRAHDPHPAIQAAVPAGTVMLSHEHLDEQFVARSAYFQEYFIPNGLRWGMGAMFHGEDGTCTLLAALRAPDCAPFDHGHAQTLASVLPHARRAAALSMQLKRRTQDEFVRSAEGMVASLPQPCLLLCGPSAGLLALNPAASVALNRFDIDVANCQIRFKVPAHQQLWLQSLRDVAATGLARSFRVPPSVQGLRSTIHLIPWRHMASRTADATDQQIVVAMFEIGVPAFPDLSGVTRDFRLSQAEREVLALVCRGMPPKTIARERSTSVNTVRAQVRSVLEKAGCHSQRELVSKLMQARRA